MRGDPSLVLPNGLVLDLEDCIYIPSLVKNIISIYSLCNEGFSCLISCNECSIYFNEIKYGDGILNNGIYVLQTNKKCSTYNIYNVNWNNLNESLLWHNHWGHINETRLTKLHEDVYFRSFKYEPYGTCEYCLLGKMTKLPFKGKWQHATEILELIHSDVCGPMLVTARGGFSYFIPLSMITRDMGMCTLCGTNLNQGPTRNPSMYLGDFISSERLLREKKLL